MIKNNSKELVSNKSTTLSKRNSNLVIKTSLENAFDSRWAEIKIEGKNINSRSNHVAIVFQKLLFIHGGYDVDKGVMSDFYSMDLSDHSQEFIWKALDNLCDGKEIKLKGHTGVCYKQLFIIFGGQIRTGISSNIVYIYDNVTTKWKSINPNIDVPKVDSHCAAVIGSKMYVYGGYVSDKAEYLKDIYAFDLENKTWEVFYKGGKQNEPQGRSNYSMIEQNDNLLLFGGTNGQHTLNDMWIFDIKTKEWSLLESKDTPDPRRGHSMVKYQDKIFMFGGIQDVTKQKNDIYIFQQTNRQWFKIHTTTNSVYDCSPTLKKGRKDSPTLNRSNNISPKKSMRGQNPMKKILEENKQKKFQVRKKQLLKQFSDEDQNEGRSRKKRELSPTTQSMLKTLQAIGNQQTSHRDIWQEIVYDESHRFIIGKKPCARDGQSVTILNGKMYIFGGDRHLMPFNDLYQFDLTLGIKSLSIYKQP